MRYRINYRFGGVNQQVSLRTEARKQTDACLHRFEENLRLVERDRQEIPAGARRRADPAGGAAPGGGADDDPERGGAAVRSGRRADRLRTGRPLFGIPRDEYATARLA
jgi:hypothetical protein